MNIVVLDAATLGIGLDLSPFNKFGDVTVFQNTDYSELVSHAGNADVVIVNKMSLGENEFVKLPKLKLICLSATGFDNIDVKSAEQRGIAVTNVPEYSTKSVAQHTFSILLYQLQSLKFYDNYVLNREYSGKSSFTNIEKSWTEIAGKNWGIIGMGNIGRSVAKIAKAFGANVFWTSTSGAKRQEEYPEIPFKELLKSCDIISIHSPLNNKTRDLISHNEFKLVKKNLILLNLGRGGIINEEALAKALDEDVIAGACLDVVTSEPINDDNPLVNMKKREKLLITPHIAWASLEARNCVIQQICENMKAFFNGEKRNRV